VAFDPVEGNTVPNAPVQAIIVYVPALIAVYQSTIQAALAVIAVAVTTLGLVPLPQICNLLFVLNVNAPQE